MYKGYEKTSGIIVISNIIITFARNNIKWL